MAERFLAERFNRPGARGRRPPRLRDLLRRRHDGGDQPGSGLDRRATSALGKLIVCYDDNHITIDGTHRRSPSTARTTPRAWPPTAGTCSASRTPRTSTRSRRRSRRRARKPSGPSFIAIRSHIAYPAPNAVDTAKSHGAPLGEEEVRGHQGGRWASTPTRTSGSTSACTSTCRCASAGAAAQQEWSERFAGLARGASRRWPRTGTGPGPGGCATAGARRCRAFAAGEQIATRSAGQKAMAAFAAYAPTMIGGAADLVESTKTRVRGRRRVLARARRAQRPVRDPRARDGRDRQRRGGARRDRQALRLDVPDLLRLHARARCACRR